jgi:hypothetical protein
MCIVRDKIGHKNCDDLHIERHNKHRKKNERKKLFSVIIDFSDGKMKWKVFPLKIPLEASKIGTFCIMKKVIC